MNLYIITGASRGMGLSLAQQLILPGHHLLCISRQKNSELDALAAGQRVPLEQWRCDLADAALAADQLALWLSSREREFESITLVNNAGVIPSIAPLSDVPRAELLRAMRVGIEAPMLLTAEFLKATANWPIPKKVLNISSGYCTAKAAMDHFTRCVALEEAIKPHGAKVCSLAPGVIDTDMQVQLRNADDKAFPDKAAFVGMKNQGSLTSPWDAASRLLSYLLRADFGSNPVADVRDVA
jgi:benzil reductase ((S)-benzoin forming)